MDTRLIEREIVRREKEIAKLEASLAHKREAVAEQERRVAEAINDLKPLQRLLEKSRKMEESFAREVEKLVGSG